MSTTSPNQPATRLRTALAAPSPSERLRAALSAGTRPEMAYVDVLVQRCAIEPDFYVRDMLTWSLVRHPASIVVPRLLSELATGAAQARSQALHTLSKIGDPAGWAAITRAVICDPDDQVARTAWRAAAVLAPDAARADLSTTLSSQLGRGDREVQLSLSRAFAALGDVALPALSEAAAGTDEKVRIHALATERLLHDPDEGFEAALFEARRILALRNALVPDDGRADR